MTRIMIDTCRIFVPRIYAGWKKSHHPHGIHLVFLAALHVVRLPRETASREDLDTLKETLRIQSGRWHIAGVFILYFCCSYNNLT
jgi:hypothetical protein